MLLLYRDAILDGMQLGQVKSNSMRRWVDPGLIFLLVGRAWANMPGNPT